LDKIGERIGVKDGDLSPWYSQGFTSLTRMGAKGILNLYSNSLYKMLLSVYPTYKWLPWNFVHSPKGIRDDPKVADLVIETVENELNIGIPEDWYRVSKPQLREMGLANYIDKSGGVVTFLTRHRPQYQLSADKFRPSRSKSDSK